MTPQTVEGWVLTQDGVGGVIAQGPEQEWLDFGAFGVETDDGPMFRCPRAVVEAAFRMLDAPAEAAALERGRKQYEESG